MAGVGPVVSRAPALAGFFVALLTVFALLRSRAGLTAAASGALLLFFTAGFRYAAEARPYGVMMGLSGVALYAWMEAAAGRRRRLHIPLLGAALAASLWNHYFGVLVFAPIVAGEAVRLFRHRRLDLPMAIAVAGAAVAALPLYPLIEVAARRRSTFWSRGGGLELVAEFYRFLLAPMLEPRFLAILIAVGAVTVGTVIVRRSKPTVMRRVPAHEVVALAVGVSIPLLGSFLGTWVTGAVVPRYVLSAIPAIGMALPLMLWRANTRGGPASLIACASLAVLVAGESVRSDRPRFRHPLAERSLLLESLHSPSPTVVSSSLQYVQFWYYAPSELKGRMIYLTDPAESLRQSGSDTIDRGYVAVSKWTAIAVEPYASFVARHQSFRVYEAGSGWLLATLESSGAAIEEIGREPGGRLYQVTLVARRTPND